MRKWIAGVVVAGSLYGIGGSAALASPSHTVHAATGPSGCVDNFSFYDENKPSIGMPSNSWVGVVPSGGVYPYVSQATAGGAGPHEIYYLCYQTAYSEWALWSAYGTGVSGGGGYVGINTNDGDFLTATAGGAGGDELFSIHCDSSDGYGFFGMEWSAITDYWTQTGSGGYPIYDALAAASPLGDYPEVGVYHSNQVCQ